jgi:hypothetical protein
LERTNIKALKKFFLTKIIKKLTIENIKSLKIKTKHRGLANNNKKVVKIEKS